MKKIIFSIAFMFNGNGIYGMETVPTVKVFRHKKFPQITVFQDDIYRRTKNADITVVGESEQIKLKKPGLVASPCVGCMSFSIDNCIMRRNKVFARYFDSYGLDDDSATIIVDGQQFVIKDVDSHTEHIKMDNKLILVREPQLFRASSAESPDLPYMYRKTASRPEIKRYSSTLPTIKYTGYKAIEEMLNDLAICYDTALDYVPYLFDKKFEIKSIAFSQLSRGLGLPAYRGAQVAVQSVVNFITDEKYEGIYDSIELVVGQSEDFDLYKMFLNECAIAKK